mmetsp:Transcript_13360/g.29703  ORF Transcript_13360/g.29703 Transcript_13360/m.29703 type:complete len:180 (-) Transcript_13360:67-606(-)
MQSVTGQPASVGEWFALWSRCRLDVLIQCAVLGVFLSDSVFELPAIAGREGALGNAVAYYTTMVLVHIGVGFWSLVALCMSLCRLVTTVPRGRGKQRARDPEYNICGGTALGVLVLLVIVFPRYFEFFNFEKSAEELQATARRIAVAKMVVTMTHAFGTLQGVWQAVGLIREATKEHGL